MKYPRFPVLSANGQFLVKDIALLGLSLWLVAEATYPDRKQTMTIRHSS